MTFKFVLSGNYFLKLIISRTNKFYVPINIFSRMNTPRSLDMESIFKGLDDYISGVKSFIPKLTSDLHKGQCGRIGIIGGSLEYTGAPYFAAISALKLGADLVYIVCCHDAAPVIKSYSPELIVYPFLDDIQAVQKTSSCLERLHALVIGPGLGRDKDVLKNVESIINYCNSTLKISLPLIIDADGLFLITQNPEIVMSYKGPIILTPNAMEYSRLSQKLSIDNDSPDKLARALNAVIIKKGVTDIICNGIHSHLLDLQEENTRIICCIPGSLRRCGGQGDILSGCTAVFVAWFVLYWYKNNNERDLSFFYNLNDITDIKEMTYSDRKFIYLKRFHGFSLACFAACCITRICSNMAFTKHGRSMTASDMIPLIHVAFEKCFEEL